MPPQVWTTTPQHYKLNVDGSFHTSNGTAGIGRIIRDSCGRLLLAFASATTTNSAIEAEMLALLRGTQPCVENGLTEDIVEGDSFII
ncbi:hypothetical protein MRB53_018838 [Persea americana]|uniref:Uncharacterized protein n=1 Tax=Persea americana TaxID=3435 RepID=A0ACC2M8W0_PERAE|nr:hypothetical protein MRB53_018838 [Persea americana]